MGIIWGIIAGTTKGIVFFIESIVEVIRAGIFSVIITGITSSIITGIAGVLLIVSLEVSSRELSPVSFGVLLRVSFWALSTVS